MRRLALGLLGTILLISACAQERTSRRISFESSGVPADSAWRLDNLVNDIAEGLSLDFDGTVDPTAGWRFHLILEPWLQTVSDQGAILNSQSGKTVIRSKTLQGLSNGVYTFLADHGVVYAHPKQSFYPPSSVNTQPRRYSEQLVEPSFAQRGFHEHTQHPIPFSAFALEASADHLSEIKAYIRWLVRNRQNVLTFHFLNTVDLEDWYPHMSAVVDFANTYGVEVGLVIGFVDQQQNAFRLVRPSESMEAPEAQIVRRLTPIMDTGVDWIGFQIGSSEFTKPDDEQMLSWLNFTVAFLSDAYPQAKPFAWIHITCGLDSDDGGSYFHLPLRADERLIGFVHTTMFYDMIDPAPVYDCEDFSHQMDFVRAANGSREMVYFPETAWWLGFDNNVPFATPIVGPSRHRDIQLLSQDFAVAGHVTFTTGREWTYWMYDHYLTRSTWDASLTWSQYLRMIGPLFGPNEAVGVALLEEWSNRQLMDFYETLPEIYFYLCGELPQDELGEQAGIVARPAKRSFNSVYRMSDETFVSWQSEELALLAEITRAYEDLFNTLPTPNRDDSSWYVELYRTYEVSSLRAAHALSLYESVEAVKLGNEQLAMEKYRAALATTERAIAIVALQEAHYRYDLELLARRRPSLTAYDYGYLEEAATGKFWTRRNVQLEALIQEVFHPASEEWSDSGGRFWLSSSEGLTLNHPQNPLLSSLLSGLMPRLLFQMFLDDPDPRLWLGVDRNENNLPDADSLKEVPLVLEENVYTGALLRFDVEVVDEGGQSQGTLRLEEALFRWDPSTSTLSIKAQLTPENVSEIVSGFGIQPEALDELLKTIWGIGRDAPVPEQLPVDFVFALEPAPP